MWRLALLTDSFGNCNAHTGSSSLTPYIPGDIVAGITKVIDGDTFPYATFNDRCGRLDYFGCIINKPINYLDIVYSRKITADDMDARYKQALFLNVFGNVIKSIVPTSNGKSPYTIQYAGFN
jgi:hypothetical protein